MRPQRRQNWRFVGVVGGLFGTILLALYPIAIQPYLDSSEWKTTQQHTRKSIVQEEVQPGGMRVWSDPFERKKR
ncbi:small integral membrane protein 20-like [Varroa jacobsoni]|uniref:small integral membrane protein 20-like n=1 Tax=Varroa jacobsoni TaxID=62625 RepID=UPI000BF8EC3B|nr:small integral membrane protein 20-like [Varroa jacobsoni]